LTFIALHSASFEEKIHLEENVFWGKEAGRKNHIM
jgi:hypothetical protein